MILCGGEGPRGSNGTCSTLCQISVTPTTTHNQIGPLWCWFLSGWACACPRPLWVSPRTSPVRLGVSCCHLNPHGCFQSEVLGLISPSWSPGLHSLFRSPAVPPGLSARMWGLGVWYYLQLPHCLSCSAIRGLAGSARPQLPISAPPTGLDEYVFFISLVVGLPYSSIFCQFWLFFVFKLLLSFFWLCEEAQCVYLRLHLGQSLSCFFFFFRAVNAHPFLSTYTAWNSHSKAKPKVWLRWVVTAPICKSLQSRSQERIHVCKEENHKK